MASFSASDTSGYHPFGAPILSTDGNLYGTTNNGGAHSSGAFYQITSSGQLTSAHSFGGGNGSGSQPKASLIRGKDGNFYGTTYEGGNNGDGAVFQLTSGGTETVLYSFGTVAGDGLNPHCSLYQGIDGNFYGTTYNGGGSSAGTVFKMTPAGVLTTLYSFSGASDGAHPFSGVVQGTDGDFYGTTHDGGLNGGGTVFQITPDGTLTTLYLFTGSGGDGANPYAGLVQGQDGDYYGSTEAGGSSGNGTIFKISGTGDLTTLYSFAGSDGADPEAALIQTSDGSFWGTTHSGGTGGNGTVFKLTVHADFFDGEVALSNGVYYLAFPNGNYLGYFSYLSDAHYIYHFDMGYEYVFDAADGHAGVYLYDFKSGGFFYTSPVFPFPYLYDFTLNTVLYYYPDPSNPGHYNTDGKRFFYRFDTGQIIVK